MKSAVYKLLDLSVMPDASLYRHLRPVERLVAEDLKARLRNLVPELTTLNHLNAWDLGYNDSDD